MILRWAINVIFFYLITNEIIDRLISGIHPLRLQCSWMAIYPVVSLERNIKIMDVFILLGSVRIKYYSGWIISILFFDEVYDKLLWLPKVYLTHFFFVNIEIIPNSICILLMQRTLYFKLSLFIKTSMLHWWRTLLLPINIWSSIVTGLYFVNI